MARSPRPPGDKAQKPGLSEDALPAQAITPDEPAAAEPVLSDPVISELSPDDGREPGDAGVTDILHAEPVLPDPPPADLPGEPSPWHVRTEPDAPPEETRTWQYSDNSPVDPPAPEPLPERAAEKPEPELPPQPDLERERAAVWAARLDAVEAALAQPVAPPPMPKQRSRGFVPLVLGGVLAGGIGYAAARYMPLLDGTDPTARVEALTGQVTALGTIGADTAAKVDALGAQVTGLAALGPEIAAATGQAQTLAAGLAALETRLTALEQRPVVTAAAPTEGGVIAGPDPAQAAELAALRQMVEEQAARTEALAAEAAALETRGATVSREVTLQAALLRLQAAMESGGPFAAALDELEVGGAVLPDGLRDDAAGLPTLIDLEREFPPAARSALYASLKATVGESPFERFTAFLQTQLGARSLNPREGNDPAATLSRAEAAVKDGALDLALTEIAALPAEGQARLEPWTTRAKRRLAAEAAVATLAASLNTN